LAIAGFYAPDLPNAFLSVVEEVLGLYDE